MAKTKNLHVFNVLSAVSLMTTACSNSNPPPALVECGIRSTVRTYQSCEELQQEIQSTQETLKQAWASGGPQAVANSAPPSADVLTNLQEQGVLEEDFVQVGENQIFVAMEGKIKVVDRKSMTLVGVLSTGTSTEPKLLIDRDRLVSAALRYAGDRTMADVKVFQIQPGQIPSVLQSYSYEGTIKNLRLRNGMLTLVLETNLPPEVTTQGRVAGVPCQQVYQGAVRGGDTRFTHVVVRNIRDLNAHESRLGWIGGSSHSYLGPKNLYVTKTYPDYSDGLWFMPPQAEKTATTEVPLDDTSGELKGIHYGLVDGWIKDSWALKEITQESKTYLAVASTVGRLGGGSHHVTNHLSILSGDGDQKDELQVTSRVSDFGRGEDIRAVRYDGHYAYVVTFEKTDPVFAINLKDVTQPVLEGELKVPGFSTYLHAISGGRMIGVGFDAADMGDFSYFQGVQISLFDIKSSTEMTRLDSTVLGVRGSYSEATGDHHAFFYDNATELLAVPIVELSHSIADAPAYRSGDRIDFVGARFYKVGQKLELRAQVQHQDLLPPYCQKISGGQGFWWTSKATSHDIRRIFKVDGNILTASGFGLKVHNLANPSQVLSTLALAASPEECPNYRQMYTY